MANKKTYRTRGTRAWDLDAGVVLWCRYDGGRSYWYVAFCGGSKNLQGSWTWYINRDRARALIVMCPEEGGVSCSR